MLRDNSSVAWQRGRGQLGLQTRRGSRGEFGGSTFGLSLAVVVLCSDTLCERRFRIAPLAPHIAVSLRLTDRAYYNPLIYYHRSPVSQRLTARCCAEGAKRLYDRASFRNVTFKAADVGNYRRRWGGL